MPVCPAKRQIETAQEVFKRIKKSKWGTDHLVNLCEPNLETHFIFPNSCIVN